MNANHKKAPIFLSVVMPLQAIDERIPAVLRETIDTVSMLVTDFEIIVVDNASAEESAGMLAKITGVDGLPNIQVYRLIHSVEYDVAAWAGVENSIGDYVLVFDAFSENLKMLPAALEEISRGREFVSIRNLEPVDRGFFEHLFSGMFRQLFSWLSEVDLIEQAAPFRLMSKRVVAYLLLQPRPALRYRTLPAVAGFSRATLTYCAPRTKGRGAGLIKRARRAVRLLMANTFVPIRIVSLIALAGAALNLLYSAYVVAIAIARPNVAAGWVTLSLQQSGMFFLISSVIFILAEYLMHSLQWAANGPPYFVASEMTSAVLTRRQRLNVEGRAPEPAHEA